MSITIIAAVALNGVIGDSKTNKMTWYNREEMQFFKDQTMGKIVVMGRKTAETTGKLVGRDCLVLSNDPLYRLHGFETVSINDLLDINEFNFDKHYMICGGAEIYRQLLPYATTAMISYMDFEASGDVFMPPIDQSVWRKVQQIEMAKFTAVNYINTQRKIHAYPEGKPSVINKKSKRFHEKI